MLLLAVHFHELALTSLVHLKPNVWPHRSTIRFKSYLAVLICLTTRAIHLEVVSQLSTNFFLLVLCRFVARLGCPHLIRSDNGTNFIGAKNYLNVADNAIADYSSKRHIQWIFNPPHAPHCGGIWESAVWSMKKHLIRVAAGQHL